MIDLNILQAMPRDNLSLPRTRSYLISDQLVIEIAKKGDESKRVGYADKLRRLVLKNRRSVYVARLPAEVCRREVRQARASSPAELILWELTKHLRGWSLDGRGPWATGFRSTEPALVEHELCLKAFMDLRSDYKEHMRRHELQELLSTANDPDATLLWIRRTPQASWICSTKPELSTDYWRQRIGPFPDRFGWARHARLTAWYSLAYAQERSRKAENDFDDLTYAFYASYTGHLATEDQCLRRTCSSCFPSVRLWSAAELISLKRSDVPPSIDRSEHGAA